MNTSDVPQLDAILRTVVRQELEEFFADRGHGANHVCSSEQLSIAAFRRNRARTLGMSGSLTASSSAPDASQFCGHEFGWRHMRGFLEVQDSMSLPSRSPKHSGRHTANPTSKTPDRCSGKDPKGFHGSRRFHTSDPASYASHGPSQDLSPKMNKAFSTGDIPDASHKEPQRRRFSRSDRSVPPAITKSVSQSPELLRHPSPPAHRVDTGRESTPSVISEPRRASDPQNAELGMRATEQAGPPNLGDYVGRSSDHMGMLVSRITNKRAAIDPCKNSKFEENTRWTERRSSISSVNSGAPFIKCAPESTRVTGLHAVVTRLVLSAAFDSFGVVLVVMNAASLGWQADYQARYLAARPPHWSEMLETLFCIAFSIELGLRIYVWRLAFFKLDWQWNTFDMVVVSLQIVEEVMGAIAVSLNFSFVRVLRVLRLVRIVRVLRIVRLVSRLRTLFCSLVASARDFLWTILLLVMLIYIASVYFTQLVTEHRLSLRDESSPRLESLYGSMGDTLLLLYQSILNGISWDTALSPLMDEVHWSTCPVFLVYITFSMLALMNVVTGVFVESAVSEAKRDDDVMIIRNVRSLFQEAHGCPDRITWPDFERLLDTQAMFEYFRAIDVDLSEARGVFDLLDIDHTGVITIDEFLSGCLRLRGAAKALDVNVLMHEIHALSRVVQELGNQFYLHSLQQPNPQVGLQLHVQPDSGTGEQPPARMPQAKSHLKSCVTSTCSPILAQPQPKEPSAAANQNGLHGPTHHHCQAWEDREEHDTTTARIRGRMKATRFKRAESQQKSPQYRVQL